MAFPSVAMLMPGGRGGSSGWICCVWVSLPLCVSVPIGMISVFSRLNFAPDARHHFCRMFSRSEYLSVEDKYMVVSSAYRLIFMAQVKSTLARPTITCLMETT